MFYLTVFNSNNASAFVEGSTLKSSDGGTGTVTGLGLGLYETTDRYFGGILSYRNTNPETSPETDIGTFDWTVQPQDLTVDEF